MPFFFVLIAVELLAVRWREVRHYRLADVINSISTGVLSTTTGLLTKGVGLVTLRRSPSSTWRLELLVRQHLGLGVCPSVYDFCYYWLRAHGLLSATSSGPRIRCITRARTTTFSTALRFDQYRISPELDLLPAHGRTLACRCWCSSASRR